MDEHSVRGRGRTDRGQILRKMNVNNCSFADGTPITLSFSKKVSEIMKHIPDDRSDDLKTAYAFYM